MQEQQETLVRRQAGYPVFVDLRNKLVVVVGGGAVAQRKIQTLLEYGPRISVVSPEATQSIQELASQHSVAWIQRPYQQGDLQGASLVFCACGDEEVNENVVAEARACGCLLNVADVPHQCDFIVPSIVRRGLLTIAASTSGASCTESSNIRKQLEEEFDESWETYLDLMSELRDMIKRDFPGGAVVRKPILQSAVEAGFRQRIASGEVLTAQQAYEETLRIAEEKTFASQNF